MGFSLTKHMIKYSKYLAIYDMFQNLQTHPIVIFEVREAHEPSSLDSGRQPVEYLDHSSFFLLVEWVE
jgi:hypothetical protein